MKFMVNKSILFVLLVIAIVITSCSASVKSQSAPSTVSTSSISTSSLPKAMSNSQSVANSTTINDVSFINAQQGLGLFRQATLNGAPGNCSLSVGQTSDAGFDFTNITKVSFISCGQAYVELDNQGVGIVYDPGLDVTDNSGNSWASTNFNDVNSATVLGNSIWALIGNCSAYNSPTQGTQYGCYLVYSTNAGKTWSGQITIPNENTFNAPSDSVTLYTSPIVVNSSNTIYLYEAGSTFQNNNTQTVNNLYTSNNNGKSWYLKSTPTCLGGSGTYLSIGQDSSVWLACGGEPSAGQQFKSVSVSNDGGTTWQICKTAPNSIEPVNTCSALEASGYLGGIFALSSKMAIIYGGRSSLSITYNSAKSFTYVVQPTTMESAMIDGGSGGVSFVNSQVGWAIADPTGSGTLWHTTDGGVNWVQEQALYQIVNQQSSK